MPGYDNHARVTVDQQYIHDEPMIIEIWQSGVRRDEMGERAAFSYVVSINGVTGVAGADLYGPATGLWSEAEEMAYTLAGFLGAAFDCGGEVTEHGRGYTPAEQQWLAVHAERLSNFSAMREADDC